MYSAQIGTGLAWFGPVISISFAGVRIRKRAQVCALAYLPKVARQPFHMPRRARHGSQECQLRNSMQDPLDDF